MKTGAQMRKVNYLNNKDILKKIHKSKSTFCSYTDDDYADFDIILTDQDVVKLSVIGVGMRSYAGAAQKMFETLADKRINIHVISTSEIKISVLIAEEYTELALRALHTAYQLDAS